MRDMVVDLRKLRRQSVEEAAPITRAFGQRTWLVPAVVLAAVIVGVVWINRDRVRTPAEPAESRIESLAVLPLKPLLRNDTDDYLGMGIADTIITRLGQIEGVTVRPTSAVRKYSSPDSDSLKAAVELKADAVLDGTVQRSGDRLRVNITLLRASDGASLWSESFNTSYQEIFAVEDEISQQVVSRLRVRLSPTEQARLNRHYTSSPEAYEYYLKGIRTFSTVAGAAPSITGDVETGLKLLERAIEIDPGYALAHAQMAWGYTWLGLFTNAGPVWIERARQALARADGLDPSLAESHVVRHLLLWSWFEGYQLIPAFEELKKAQQMNPNVGHWELGAFYGHFGMVEAAMRALERAAEIDPTNDTVRAERVIALWVSARYAEAIAENEKLGRPLSGPQTIVAYVGAGRLNDARPMIDEALARNPNDRVARDLRAVLVAKEGKHTEAAAMLVPLSESQRMGRAFHHAAYNRACVYALASNANIAVEWLRDTVKAGMPNYPAFSRDSCFDPIRRTPQFIQFMAELEPVWKDYEVKMR
jgi:TolB-like protein/Tfp pilus assembly protein PilF